jgi:hypothetical protein
MLLVLEKFFDTRVAAPPYRPNYLATFTRILLCPIEPLKDIVSIIRFVGIHETLLKMVTRSPAGNPHWLFTVS